MMKSLIGNNKTHKLARTHLKPTLHNQNVALPRTAFTPSTLMATPFLNKAVSISAAALPIVAEMNTKSTATNTDQNAFGLVRGIGKWFNAHADHSYREQPQIPSLRTEIDSV